MLSKPQESEEHQYKYSISSVLLIVLNEFVPHDFCHMFWSFRFFSSALVSFDFLEPKTKRNHLIYYHILIVLIKIKFVNCRWTSCIESCLVRFFYKILWTLLNDVDARYVYYKRYCSNIPGKFKPYFN